ncbi:hypothetical protein B0T11DRAFT_337359 [Plectosphaerella cucumerina]|uniref:Rhodopsin domain-containing protein n=1 Tax=Plectosphaerella cucumerina TaxID=40658 RepID=A0A8K0TJX8_9PEZI|nr:hypothetical protein B0T11DRAFT_337359 [Plectosphaerella cucumerina]
MAIENRGPELQAVGIGFLAFAYVAVALRSYVRIFIVKAFGLDDWIMLLALFFYTLHNIAMFIGIYHGTGRHFADLTPEGISGGMMNWYLDLLAYSATMIASKTSIAVFLLRITGTKPVHRWIIYGALAFSVVTTLAFFFVCMLQCKPISYFWTRSGDGSCFDIKVVMALTYTFSSFSLVTDAIFTILPIFCVWGLNMSLRNKLLLIPIFFMGTVASSAVAVRFAYVKTFTDPDFLWATLDIAIWSNVEMGLAIAAGSLATLRPLLRIALNRLGLSSTGQYRKYNTNTGSNPSRIKPISKPRNLSEEDFNPAELYNLQHINTRKTHAWADPQDPEIQASSKLKVTTETRITVSRAPTPEVAESSTAWKAREEIDNDSEDGVRPSSHGDPKDETPAVPTSFLYI